MNDQNTRWACMENVSAAQVVPNLQWNERMNKFRRRPIYSSLQMGIFRKGNKRTELLICFWRREYVSYFDFSWDRDYMKRGSTH